MISISRTNSRGQTVTLLSALPLSPVPQNPDADDRGEPRYFVDEVRDGIRYYQRRPGDPMIAEPAHMHRCYS